MHIKNFNIAKDNICDVLENGFLLMNKDFLIKYYLEQKCYADELTISGEFTGKTYDNLDYLKNKLSNGDKCLKKVAC